MCIRDRYYGDYWLSYPYYWWDSWIEVPELYNYASVANPFICLLYTSDAADDLLCVDLGGRRNIKKKNKKEKMKEQADSRASHR